MFNVLEEELFWGEEETEVEVLEVDERSEGDSKATLDPS